MFLTEEFLAGYPAQPENMTEIGVFTAYRTYARWVESAKRRETWKEAVTRAVEYSVEQSEKRMKELGYPFDMDMLKKEAEALFDNIFNVRQFLSGRTHWVGGADTKVAEKFPLANFNCSFIEVTKWEDLAELFYLLLVGTGVGVRASKEGIADLPSIRKGVELKHVKYNYNGVGKEDTVVSNTKDGIKITVGDSKEGWVDALRQLLKELVEGESSVITVGYNNVRPRGTRLQTFGGTASGPEPLQAMFEGIMKVIDGTIDTAYEPPQGEEKVQLRPVHILDIANLIGNNVVVGGVRRTAEIFLCDSDDWESITAKYGINGIWSEEQHIKVMEKFETVFGFVPDFMKNLALNDPQARPQFHRRMSNNSVAFETKPSREYLNLLFELMQLEGEPGFVNVESASKRRPNMKGLNPCAEILLDSYGVCNLTTVNVKAFVQEVNGEYHLDFGGLMQAQTLSARAGLRMTLLDLELPHWNEVHKRDRLTGTSLTGWYDAMDMLGYDKDQEAQLLEILQRVSNDATSSYAHTLRVPTPLLITTVKPEGTLSQVAGGVSSGLHRSFAPFYKRRIRINSNDALVDVARELGWTIHAEVGTAGFNDEENLGKEEVIKQANTVVVTFPIKSGAKTTKADITVEEQFDTYFMFQENYTQHNSSNTIYVKPGEWEKAEQIVWDNWDDFIGVSFLADNGGSYVLAPYEEITEEQYNELVASTKPFDVELLHKYERAGLSDDVGELDCSAGACGIR